MPYRVAKGRHFRLAKVRAAVGSPVMSVNPSSVSGLWPASQLLLTADTADAAQALLDPRSQLRFLTQMATLAGPEVFADSLVYSTPAGNTGWTALRMGTHGHVTYHHWDAATPNL